MSNQYPATTQVPKAPTDTDINKAVLDLLSKINSTNEYTDEQIASLKDAVILMAHPIGEIQVQYPGQDTPEDLYGGKWTNVTSMYAGQFFRAEGGKALPFNGGVQQDALENHRHSLYGSGAGAANAKGLKENGAISIWATDQNASPSYASVIGSTLVQPVGDPISDGTSSIRVDTETRPVNQSIRIWKRRE